MLEDKTEGKLQSIKAFAAQYDRLKQFEEQLDYLANYGQQETRCLLYEACRQAGTKTERQMLRVQTSCRLSASPARLNPRRRYNSCAASLSFRTSSRCGGWLKDSRSRFATPCRRNSGCTHRFRIDESLGSSVAKPARSPFGPNAIRYWNCFSRRFTSGRSRNRRSSSGRISRTRKFATASFTPRV